jgi:hypothetical protein
MHSGIIAISVSMILANVLGAGCAYAVNVQELLLLLEVTELYCLVCPGGSTDPELEGAWTAFQRGVIPFLSLGWCPEEYEHAFAAAGGAGLLSIAEYLTEDALLVMDGASPPTSSNFSTNIANSSSVAGCSRQHSTTAGSSSAGAAAAANASSSGGIGRRATTGSRHVPQSTRMAWAQQVVDCLGILSFRLQQPNGVQHGQLGEHGWR